MTDMTKPSWTDLNAYVDGELPPDAAARIAAAIASDGELAAWVAALARLKAATGDALAVDPAEVPDIRLSRPAARPTARTGWRWPAIAAGILLAVVIGMAGWSLAPNPSATRAWLAAAEARHADWLADDPHPVPVDERAVILTDVPGGPERVPDLGLAHLSVAHLTVDASGRQPGLYIGYVGVNGCRLGLWIGPAPEGLPADLTEHRDAEAHSFTWRVGDMGYAVMARDMDARRLTAVAGYLERLTRTGVETRTAGLDGAAADAPCIA